MEKSDKQGKPSFLQLFREFAGNTSLLGVNQAMNSTHFCVRLIWSLIVLTSSGIALYQLLLLMQEFFTYPVVTVVTLKHESKIKFPAITICNNNPIRKSMISDDDVNEMNSVQLERYSKFQGINNAFIRTLDKDTRSKASHQLPDMLINCLFKGEQCTLKNFKKVDTGLHGTCYTFKVEDKDRYISKPGPQNGLVIEINIQHEEYTSFAPEAGVKVIVHEEDEAPFPDEGGILAQPGMLTSIAIKKTIDHRLPSPYGQCAARKGASSKSLSLFDDEGYNYTENACRKSCYQMTLIKKCECCDIDLPCDDDRINKLLNLDSDKITYYCNTSHDEEVLHCVYDVDTTFIKGNLDCLNDCVPVCDQTTYEKVVSTALWPSDPYLDVLKHHVVYHSSNSVEDNSDHGHDYESSGFDSEKKTSIEGSTVSFLSKDFISKNFLKLEIFYEKLDFLQITTDPKYDWNSLLGNVGGHLGLWLGFSIITALELLHLMFDVAVVCVKKATETETVHENSISLNTI